MSKSPAICPVMSATAEGFIECAGRDCMLFVEAHAAVWSPELAPLGITSGWCGHALPDVVREKLFSPKPVGTAAMICMIDGVAAWDNDDEAEAAELEAALDDAGDALVAEAAEAAEAEAVPTASIAPIKPCEAPELPEAEYHLEVNLRENLHFNGDALRQALRVIGASARTRGKIPYWFSWGPLTVEDLRMHVGVVRGAVVVAAKIMTKHAAKEASQLPDCQPLNVILRHVSNDEPRVLGPYQHLSLDAASVMALAGELRSEFVGAWMDAVELGAGAVDA